VIFTCFTGEGVAEQLRKVVAPIIDETKIEIIVLQFLHKEAFRIASSTTGVLTIVTVFVRIPSSSVSMLPKEVSEPISERI
ncbi:hypothetical protein, partial [Listeria monocytogenes]|uniref:hypothetical protein n=1 Tax=Listeria monocytogenes TaxID=1639 RepID=UPI001F0D0AAE